MKLIKKTFPLSAITLAIATVNIAYADDNNSEPTTELGSMSVVVANPLYYIDSSDDNDEYRANVATVGTKIPVHLEDLPQSVTVITQKKLDDINVDTLDQLARRTTGMRVLKNDNGRSSIYARGYEYNSYSIDGLSSPMASIYGNMPNLVAFDRVEVLRGPSGLFDSSSEMGGVVNLVRKRGNLYDPSSIKFSISDPKGYEVTGDYNGALDQAQTVFGRAIVQYTSNISDAVDNVGGDPNTNTTAYFSLDKYFDDSLTNRIGAGYMYQERNITPNNGFPTYADKSLMALPSDRFYGAKWNDFKGVSHIFFADGRYQLPSKGLLSAGVRYTKSTADFNYIFAGSGLDANDKTAITGTATHSTEKALSADINLSQPFMTKGGQSEFVVGVDYKSEKDERTNARPAKQGVPASNIMPGRVTVDGLNNYRYVDILRDGYVSYSSYDAKETAFYGKVNYHVSEPLSVILGGRFSSFDITYNGYNLDDNKFTGYGALVYEFAPRLNGYVSYTQIYTPQEAFDKNNQLLKPREGEQWEAGLKARFNNRLSSRLSVYRLVDTNAAAPDASNSNYSVPLGKRRMQGLELEANGKLTDNLEISGGYAYLDSDVKVAVGNTGSGSDATFLLMPKHTVNLWANYDWHGILPQPLTLGLGVNYVGSFSSSQGVTASSATTWDMMASYRFSPQLKGQLNVYNLFDKDYYARVGSLNTFNIAGDSREVKLSLTYEF